MAYTTQGTAHWGVSEGTKVTGVTGVITDIEIGDEMMLEPQRNEVGAVTQQAFYDRRKTVNVTVEVASGTEPPKLGTSVTVAGVQGYVNSARVTESNSRYRAFQIGVEGYPNCKTVKKYGTPDQY